MVKKHISIEGMDGVGKTTICNDIANKSDFIHVEKPLEKLFGFENYIEIRNKVNNIQNRVFTSWFYGLSNIYLYEKYKDKYVVTDRHLVSNYAWSGEEKNLDIYRTIIKKIGKPTLTVILYANEEIIYNRIKSRFKENNDLPKIKHTKMIYEKMEYFCNKLSLPYIFIDSSDLSVNEITRIILERVGN